jgi:hypothetical protein
VPTAKHLLVGLCTDTRADEQFVKFVAEQTVSMRLTQLIHRSLKARNQEMITRQQGEEMAKMLKLGGYVECSALTGEGADDGISLASYQPTPSDQRRVSQSCERRCA